MLVTQKFKVNDQIIAKANAPVLVADSVNVIEFAFEFSELWANVFKTAVITTGGGVLTASDFSEFQSLIDETYHPVITENEPIAEEEC